VVKDTDSLVIVCPDRGAVFDQASTQGTISVLITEQQGFTNKKIKIWNVLFEQVEDGA